MEGGEGRGGGSETQIMLQKPSATKNHNKTAIIIKKDINKIKSLHKNAPEHTENWKLLRISDIKKKKTVKN